MLQRIRCSLRFDFHLNLLVLFPINWYLEGSIERLRYSITGNTAASRLLNTTATTTTPNQLVTLRFSRKAVIKYQLPTLVQLINTNYCISFSIHLFNNNMKLAP